MREINSQDVRVFVIWEPVLPTDFVTCSENTAAQPSCGTTSRYMRRERYGKMLRRSRFILTIRSAT